MSEQHKAELKHALMVSGDTELISAPAQGLAAQSMEERLLESLREVMDPEMPVNVVDLGLIYGVEEVAGEVKVKLTLTAMGCPGSDFIIGDIKERILREEGVKGVEVEVVWSPPWSAKMISEAGRDALEMWGLAL